MKLDFLDRFDAQAAKGLIASAILAQGSTEEQIPEETAGLLREVRKTLGIETDDLSDEAQAKIARALAAEIKQRVFAEQPPNEALSRAGQAGRLPPDFYGVDMPKVFLEQFRTLAIRPNHLERVVRFPDDYQFPLAAAAVASDRDAISLFIKEAPPTKSRARHWLLVQTYRLGVKQVVQSAWHIFEDLGLEGANTPLDVLRALVAQFGLPFAIEGQEITNALVESIVIRKPTQLKWGFAAPKDFFASLSFTDVADPDQKQIGLGFGINLPPYRAYLNHHGLMTKDEMDRFNREGELATERLAAQRSQRFFSHA